MNSEVTAVVENAGEEKKEENGTECVFVELGQVTKDTQSGPLGSWDLGFGRQF